MIFPFPEEFTFVAILIFAIHVLGFLNAIDAVRNVRTSQGAIAWGIVLVLFPYAAIPLYWILGARSHTAYRSSLARAEEAYREQLIGYEAELLRFEASVDPKDEGTRHLLKNLVRWPITRGNHVRLLVDGEETFSAIFAAIEQAKKYVIVQFYIVRDDTLGRQLKEKLIERARAGVRVYFMCDAVGSWGLSSSYLEDLTSAGVLVERFRVAPRFTHRLKINFRNHRKIVIVDGNEAFIGGHNVGDEYLGKNEEIGEWRDTHLAISGPAVKVAQLSVAGDWYWVTSEVIEVDWLPSLSESGDSAVLPVPSGPTGPFEVCALLFQDAISSAESRLWIASPYFVPDEGIVTALQRAALRGVDVRILLPLKPDQSMVWLASFAYFEPMVDAGVSLYRYTEGFLHQKVLLVDDRWASVGTANFDNRSFRLNFEISTLCFDREFVAEVANMLEKDFARSDDVTEDDIANLPPLLTLAASISRLFAPIL